jgi:Fic family protein
MPRWDVNFDMHLDDRDSQVVSRVAMAHALATVIRDIPIPPSVKKTLDALNILRAVRGTTGIEGAELTEDEVRQIMESPRKKPVLPQNRSREEQEARNAQKVMSYVVKELTRDPNIPLTEKLICTIHRITTKDINYADNIPGKYRTHKVYAGSYTPPGGEDVRKLMREFIQWFNMGAPSAWDPIIRAIVAHFYVVSIHPFGDGNGRTSRGVESFLLYKAGVNARSFYSLANYYYKYRREYVQWLDYVRFQSNGELTPFVLFALKGLVGELQQVHSEVLKVRALESEWLISLYT